MAVKSVEAFEGAKVIAIAVGLGGTLWLGYKIVTGVTDLLGLTKSEAKKKLDAALLQAAGDSTKITDQNNPYVAFNPNFANAIVTAWKKKYPGQVWNTSKQAKFSEQQYKDMADRIESAPGWFNDNEDTLYDIFRTIQTQWQLSLLSSFFHTYNEKDLFLFLTGFLSDDEMGNILNIIKNYPQYLQ